MKAKDSLIVESVGLPAEIRDKDIKEVQISFLFDDGKMHHVKPPIHAISKRLAEDCLKRQTIRYSNYEFLDEDDFKA